MLSNTKDKTINSDCQDLYINQFCFNAGLARQDPKPPEREDLKLNIFQAITPNHNYEIPQELIDRLIFMELVL
jgi:hypothetical protein